jgi:hypothetical protein
VTTQAPEDFGFRYGPPEFGPADDLEDVPAAPAVPAAQFGDDWETAPEAGFPEDTAADTASGSGPVPGGADAASPGPVPPEVPGTAEVPASGSGNPAAQLAVSPGGPPPAPGTMAALTAAAERVLMRLRDHGGPPEIPAPGIRRPAPLRAHLQYVRACGWAAPEYASLGKLAFGMACQMLIGIPLAIAGIALEITGRFLTAAGRATRHAAAGPGFTEWLAAAPRKEAGND